MPLRLPAGRSAVTRRAIADIVRSSVRGSYGVVGFATPTLGGHLVRALGLGEPGIRVAIDDGVSIELHLLVASGLPIAEVARQVDSAVRYALRRDLGRQTVQVTVHVDGLEYQPGRIPESDPTDALEGDGVAGEADGGVETVSHRIGGAA